MKSSNNLSRHKRKLSIQQENQNKYLSLENKFVNLIQICLLDKLFELLLPVNFRIITDCEDLKYLSRCNKFINKVMIKKFISFLEYPLHSIQY
jgi:hypothetical protein